MGADAAQSNFQEVELSDADFKAISDWGAKNYSRNNTPCQYAVG